MKTIGIFYGSTTGNTADAAKQIADAMGVDSKDVYDVTSASPDKVADYDVLILGTSTWGSGDLQDDWEDFVAALEAMDLSDKTIALFGTGDETMSDTFCDGVGTLYNRLTPTGARFIGSFNVDGFDFQESTAVGPDGMGVGLLLDDMNHLSDTPARIDAWTKELAKEI